jgi:hypothetical protein
VSAVEARDDSRFLVVDFGRFELSDANEIDELSCGNLGETLGKSLLLRMLCLLEQSSRSQVPPPP